MQNPCFSLTRSRTELKTSMEQQYEKRILYHICSLDMPIGERVSLLQDFHNNSADYYDRLCDILYAIANASLHLPVWMTASGRFYAASAPPRQTDLHITDAQSVPKLRGSFSKYRQDRRSLQS